MCTFFKCEQIVKNTIPSIEKIRFYPTSENFVMNAYFECKDGTYDESLIPQIKDLLPCHLNYQFKDFKETINDNLPIEPTLPKFIIPLALETTGTAESFEDVVQKALNELNITKIDILETDCVINITVDSKLSDSDIEKFTIYAQSVAPMWCKVNLICK